MPLFSLVQFRFDLCLTNPRVTGSLLVKDIDEINKFMQVSSKTSMSNAILHNLESGSNELQSGFSENQLKLIEKADTQPYLAKCRIQNLVVYNTLPESFACFFDPQRTFGNPLQAVFSKIEIFSGTAKFSSLYAGGRRVPPRVLAVWAKTLRGQ